MTDTPDDWGFRTAENVSIALICPECGKKNPEIIAHLKQRYRYGCRGDGCTYVFDFGDGKYGPLIEKIANLCDQFDALPTEEK
jgi:hypothetical protein